MYGAENSESCYVQDCFL